MKFANRIKTTNNKVIFALIAVVALTLVFLQMPILNYAQQARADAAAEVSAQAEKAGSVDVKFSFDHAFVVYDGQKIAPPATKVTLPVGSDLVFTAEADNGYEIKAVEAVLGGTKTKLTPNDSGEYKVSANALQDGKAKVSVDAVTAVEESEGEIYQGDAALDEPVAATVAEKAEPASEAAVEPEAEPASEAAVEPEAKPASEAAADDKEKRESETATEEKTSKDDQSAADGKKANDAKDDDAAVKTGDATKINAEGAEDKSAEAVEKMDAATEKGSTASGAKEANKRNEQKKFVYSDDNVTVTANLSKPEALPSGAQFVVTPVTDKTEGYNYNAYMTALNYQATNGFQYTDKNTLLFDVAFMIPKTDGNGKAVEGEFVEAQLEEGTVTIKVDFKKDQLTKGLNAKSNSDIEIKHLPLVESTRKTVESTSAATDITVDDIVVEDVEKPKVESNEVSFKVDSLSMLAATNPAFGEAIAEVSLRDGNGSVVTASDLQGTYYLLCKITKFYEPWNSDVDYYWCSDAIDLKSGKPVSMSLNDKEFKQGNGNDTVSYDGAKSVSFALVDAYPTEGHQRAALMNGERPWVVDKNASAYVDGSTLEGNTVSISFNDPNGLQADTARGDEQGAALLAQSDENAAQNRVSGPVSFVFQDNATQSHSWAGTNAISASDIFGILAAKGLDEFAVVAKNLITDAHIEGNVRVAQFTIEGGNNSSANLNEGQRMLTQNTVSSVTIKKTIVGSGDGTFQFGFYVGGNKVGSPVSITTEGGSGSITLTKADASDLFSKLNEGKQCEVYELDDAGNPVAEGGTFGNYTVSYSYGETGSALATSNLDNFFGKIVTSGTNGVDAHFFRPGGTQNTNYFGQEPVERDGALYIGDNFRINNTKKSSEYVYIEGLEEAIKSDVDSVSTLSANLANAKNGDASTMQSDVSVINLKSTQDNLKADLEAAGFSVGGDGVPGVVRGIVDSGQPLLINIDLTGKSDYSINGQSIYYDGKNPQGENGYTEIGALVVYNFVTKDGSGYKPYSGNIKISDWSAGVLMAPNASVDQSTAYWVGEIIAKNVTHSGSEIHKKTTAKSREKAITVAVENEGEAPEKGSLQIKKNVTLNGSSTTGSEVDGTYSFIVRKDGDNLNVRTATVTIENGQSATTQIDDLEPGDYVVTESVDSNPSGVRLVSNNGVTVKVEGNNSANVPVAEFTNNKVQATGKVTFRGVKNLTGREMTSDDVYSFEVKEGDKVVATGTSGADGTISFTEIAYTQADVGEHTYKIRETSTDANGVKVDTTIYTVTVNVIDDGGDTLKIETSDNANQLNFTNAYTASGSATLSGMKTIEGRNFKQGDEFTFTVTADAGTPMPKKDGKEVTSVTVKPTKGTQAAIDFGTIAYTQDDIGKTYAYTIRESVPEGAVNGKINGVTYAAQEQVVLVTVSDNGNGTLKVTYGEGDSATETAPTPQFTNAYTAEGSVEIAGAKTLEGQQLSAETAAGFTYEILDDQGERVGTGTTNADGSIAFSPIAYYLNADNNDLGEHSYTVREIIPSGSVQVESGKWAGKWKNGCYLYDGTNHTVVVNVTDNGDGTLAANVVSVDGDTAKKSADFANAYEASGSVTIFATKELAGRALANGEFSFELKDESGAVLQTVTNDEHGGITFAKIDYTLDDLTKNEDGTYAETTKTYTISEVAGSVPGVTYSEDVLTVTVVLADNGNGTLSAVPSYAGSTSTISNSYNAEGSATVAVTKNFDSWNDSSAFQFVITAAEGAPLPNPSTVTVTSSSSDKSASFGSINYTTSDLAGGEVVDGKLTKTFTYTVQEVAPAHVYDGITYDDAPRTVTITATDEGNGTISTTQTVTKDGAEANLTFTNAYDANGSVTFQGEKTMKDRSLTASDTFSFTIVQCDKDGKPLKDLPGYIEGSAYEGTATATGASGKIAYPQITYTRNDMLNADGETYATSKTFYYAVTEDVPADATIVDADGKTVTYENATEAQRKAGGFVKDGVTYASDTKIFTVEVTDDGKGTLNAVATAATDAAVAANAEASTPETAGHFDAASRSSAGLTKTATNLNGNYDSTVRVKLQGESAPDPQEEKKTYDIVFVVDTSQSQGDTATVLMNKMFQEAQNGGYNVNIGIVKYYYVAKVARYLDGTPGWNGSDSGTNLPAGILLGTKLLDDDNSVADEDKYLVILSDGDTYIYQKNNELNSYTDKGVLRTNGDDAMVVTQLDSDYTNVPFAGPGSYSWKYHNGSREPEDFAAPDSWDEYFATVGPQVLADKGAYETKWNWQKNNLYSYVTNAIPEDEISQHANSADTSLYYSLVNYRAASEKYHTYATYVKGRERPYGESFLAYLNGGASLDLSKLENKLASDLAAGAAQVAKGGMIRDVIGHGTDNKGNAYDMDFVNRIETTDIILNGKTLAKTVNADGTFAFGQGSDGKALFTLTYTGKAEPGTEGYTVQFSNEVLATDTVEMRYNVHLANPQSKAGTYGNYVETGTPTGVEGLLVSSGATFERGGTTQAFAKPVVNYSALGFDNSYTAKGSVAFAGAKSVEGRSLTENDAFSFEVKEGDEVIATGTSGADGTISFPEIVYTLADVGTHTYMVSEVVPAGVDASGKLNGVSYSAQTQTVTVTVSDNGDGTLKVVPSENYQSLNFVNAYEATGSVIFAGAKSLTGRAMTADDVYSFVVKEGDEVVGTGTSGADGTISFSEIAYTLADVGTHTYTVSETAPEGVDASGKLNGVSYSAQTQTVTVTVSDNGDGTLKVEKSGNAGELSFNNSYIASGSVQLKAHKTLSNKKLEAGAFEFELSGYGIETPITAANDAAGDVSFGSIAYTLADVGTHTYTIKEVVPGDAEDVNGKKVKNGIVYDGHEETVTVTVTDNGKGTLVTQAAYSSGETAHAAEFTNSYSASGSYEFTASKTLNGAAAKGYSFTLSGGSLDEGTSLSATSGEDGIARFGAITYTLDDVGKTYIYSIKESIPDGAKKNAKGNYELAGYTYDGHEAKVAVKVTDKGNGTLAITPVEAESNGSTTFANTYEASGEIALVATKRIDTTAQAGIVPAEGTYSFELSGDGITTPMTASNDAQGNATFATITYGLGDVGLHEYTIKEVIPSDAAGEDGKKVKDGVTYDGHVAKVVVNVTDDGNGNLNAVIDATKSDSTAFTNIYDATGSVAIQGKKVIENRSFKEGDSFTFTIAGISAKDAQGNEIKDAMIPLPKNADGQEAASVVVNPTAGNEAFFAFDNIVYGLTDVGKTYTYTVTESGSGDGVTNDKNWRREFTVSVADNGDGTLGLSVDGYNSEEGIVFTNTYNAKGDAQLAATKALSGRSFKEGDTFTFKLAAVDGAPMPTNADGTVNDEVTITPSEGSEASATFAKINYTLADLNGAAEKVFAYEITEVTGSAGGMSYSKDVKHATVKVTDNKTGRLSTEVSYSGNDNTFTNTYTASGSATVGGTKEVANREFKSGDSITFTLTPGEGVPAIAEGKDTITITPTAGTSYNFAFPEIPYTLNDAGKTYTYTMTEQATMDGVASNDTREHTVTVAVGADKGDGALEPCTVTYGGVGNTFVNTYDATGSVTVEGKKALEGRDFKDGDTFTFTIAGTSVVDAQGNAVEGATAPLPKNASGQEVTSVVVSPTEGNEVSFAFGDISYGLADVGRTYTYTVTESGTVAGVTNDAATHTLTVKVSDPDKNGQLKVESSYSDADGLKFTNVYAASGDTTLKAKKHYEGTQSFPAGLFSFELYSLSAGEDQQVVEQQLQTKAISKNDETVSFNPVHYDEAGTYYYAIREVIPSGAEDLGDSHWYNAGYNYDAHVAIVKVVVEDDGAGTLVAKNYYKVSNGVADFQADEGYVEDVEGSAVPVFTNRAEAKGEAVLTVSKAMTGRTLKEGESYSFELLTRAAGGAETVLQTKATTENGTVVFDPIAYTKPGEYTYYIREIQPTGEGVTQNGGKNVKDGVTYDSHEVKATVSVAWGTEDGQRKLLATTGYEGGASFQNAYISATEIVLKGTKTVENRDFKEGDTLTFAVAADTAYNTTAPLPNPASVTINPNAGKTAAIDYGKISYNQGDAGKTYYYTVTESAEMDGVSGAAVVHKFHVDIDDDGMGHLTATKIDDTEGGVDALSFTNVYDASGSTTIQGVKAMTGRDFKAGDSFTFTLTGSDGAPMPDVAEIAVTPSAGNSELFGFGPIDYTLADVGKTYTYTVTESGSITGVNNDAATHTATVTVSDPNKNGQLKIETKYSDGDKLKFTNVYAPSTKIDLLATKGLVGRIVENGEYKNIPTTRKIQKGEFTFELLENGKVIASAANNETGQAWFSLKYELADVGDHTYTMREVVPADDKKVPGIVYTEDVQTFTVHVVDQSGTLVVSYDNYDPAQGVTFTNTYITSGEVVLNASKMLDGANPAKDAYEFQLLNADNKVVDTAHNNADGTVTFAKQSFDHPGTYEYTIVETLPEGAQQLGPNWVYDNVAYDRGVSHAKVVATDNGEGGLDCVVTYDEGNQKVFQNSTVSAVKFPLGITKVMNGRAFKTGDKFTFTVEGSEGAPMPAEATVVISPTEGASATGSFGDISYTANDLGKTYTYTIREAAAPEDSKGVTNDPFSHTVAVTIGGKDDGTLSVSAVYDSNPEATGVVFTNTYEATGQAKLFAQKTLNGRTLGDDEFFFTLKGDGLAKPLHASANANGRAEFAPINYTQADAGKDFTYIITEDPGQLPGVAYDTSEQTVTVHVADNGDGTLAVTYADGKNEFAGAPFTNTYKAANTKIGLKALKTLSGSEMTEGQFQFTLRGTSENAASTTETVANAADGTVSFTEIEYDKAGTYEYEIKEVIPDGAVDNHDGTFRKGTIVYDGRAHNVVVNVVDNEMGSLVATATYDGYTALTITNAMQLTHTGFKFNKYLFGATGGTFDFTLKAVDKNGAERTGDKMDIAEGAEIVDDGTASFTLTAQNGVFGDGNKAEVVFPEISFAADGDYYYLVSEGESKDERIVADKAEYLIHVVVSDNEVVKTTYNLLYEGTDCGETEDLSFYNNAAVTLGFNSLSAQSYNDDRRISVYPKVQKLLNDGTDLLVGGEFKFELVDAETGQSMTDEPVTNDENGVVAFFDEKVDPGLAYDEPGVYRYFIREVPGDEAGITYDDSVVTLVVTVTEDETGTLSAETLYNGPAGLEGDASKPAFHNTKEGMDVRVQKVSRYGGEGLANCTYALWMVGENGDVLVQEAVSDAQGYITFKNVNLMKGAKYYFKEVEAPSGHTVDPYRTAYFSLNENGDALVLVEKTASDGWHSATENMEAN